MSERVKKQSRVVKEFLNTHFMLYLKENNVLTIETKDIEYDRQLVELVTSSVKEFTEDKKYLVLVLAGEHSSIAFEGLKSLARPEAFVYAHAKAYVIKTLAQRMMLNFYLKFFQPKIPIRIFTKKQEAEVWLLKKFRHLMLEDRPNHAA